MFRIKMRKWLRIGAVLVVLQLLAVLHMTPLQTIAPVEVEDQYPFNASPINKSTQQVEKSNLFVLDDSSVEVVPSHSPDVDVLRALGVTESFSSDIASLSHCNLSELNMTTAEAFLKHATNAAKTKYQGYKMKVNHSMIHEEALLQGLELYARAAGHCDYSLYRPRVPISQVQQEMLQGLVDSLPRAPPGEARLVFCISVHDDVPQLEALLPAIVLPQHLVVLHLERRAGLSTTQEVERLANAYPNVVVLKYGSVTYLSESITTIFLQIMQLMRNDLDFSFDYFFTMGSSSYPLWGAHELAEYLHDDEKRVRIGQLLMKASGGATKMCRTHGTAFGMIFSRGLGPKEFVPLPAFVRWVKELDAEENIFPAESVFPANNLSICNKKVNSGNTAAYDYDAAKELLSTPASMEFLARFKQSGLCCNEELSWGGALTLSGREQDISKPGMIWQAWACHKSTRNIVLRYSENGSTKFCASVYDTVATRNRKKRDLHGYDELKKELGDARKRGHLFARKFHSSDPYWVNWIRTTLHKT